MKNSKIRMVGLTGIPKISQGMDLAKEIIKSLKKNNIKLENGDILVIAQSVVSKSLGRVINLNDVVPKKQALDIYRKMEKMMEKEKVLLKNPQLIQLIIDESKNILRSEHVIIVETKFGFICANAGIDKSNVEGRDNVTLLPLNPDAEANKIRKNIKTLTGKNVAIIISDSFGRPFRRGSVGIAIGISGIAALLDKRGFKDLYGKTLVSTIVGQVDNLASAAQLIMGEADEGLPVILIKGYSYTFKEIVSIKEIFRQKESDLFNVLSEKDLIYNILKSRRSYKREFSSKEVDKGIVKECIEIATWAPSAHNAQQWRYIILGTNKIRENLITKMNLKLRKDLKKDGKSENFIQKKIRKTRLNFLDTPFLILICLDEDALDTYPDQERKNKEYLLGIQSIAASASYFLLAVEANKLAACWYCAPLFAQDIIIKELNLPNNLKPIAFFTLGYPKDKIKPPSRKKLKDVIYELGD